MLASRGALRSLDSASVRAYRRRVFVAFLRSKLWLLAGAFLALAQATHFYEHWEIASHKDCVAHADSGGERDDGGSRHDHGCNSHDHAPAVLAGHLALTRSETVHVSMPVYPAPPCSRASSIDHPPQLS